jgi:uncharacterized membrane protein
MTPPPAAKTPPATPVQAPSRRLKIALAVSVALNLGVLGLALGDAVHDMRHGPGDMVRAIGFGPFTDALRPEDHDALRAQFMARMPDFRSERKVMAADTRAVLTALRAEPFDPAGLETALASMESHIIQRMGLGRGMIEEFITSLSPADRLAFADRLEQSLRHGPGNDG